MKTDGPGTPSLAERLKAKSEEDLREAANVTRRELMKHVENLKASSNAALKETENSIRHQLNEIDEMVSVHHARIESNLAEIATNPKRTMRRTMIVSAVIGALVATIPWAAMTYLGISATGTVGTWLDQRTEIARQEAWIEALRGVGIRKIDGHTVLMLPQGTEMQVCGEALIPCIRIGE